MAINIYLEHSGEQGLEQTCRFNRNQQGYLGARTSNGGCPLAVRHNVATVFRGVPNDMRYVFSLLHRVRNATRLPVRLARRGKSRTQRRRQMRAVYTRTNRRFRLNLFPSRPSRLFPPRFNAVQNHLPFSYSPV